MKHFLFSFRSYFVYFIGIFLICLVSFAIISSAHWNPLVDIHLKYSIINEKFHT